MGKTLIAPSILSADFNTLKEEIEAVENAGAEYLHFDVMDGHFVDNISFGIPVLKSISHSHKMVNDVHIMISDPYKYAKEFVKAGADIVTFHLEATESKGLTLSTIKEIKRAGAKVGISIRPKTDVRMLNPYLDQVDLVLVMSVEPGFGGQEFMKNALGKIFYLNLYRQDHNLKYLIEVDGGINKDTARYCRMYGADVLVAGSYIFKSDNYKERIDSLRK